MVAIDFQGQFVDKIRKGEKRQTIRRTQRATVGQKIQLYTGQRTKDCMKIKDVVCTVSKPIAICDHAIIIDYAFRGALEFSINRKYFDDFAKADGFDTWEAMTSFFERHYGPLPFHGYLIGWDDVVQ